LRPPGRNTEPEAMEEKDLLWKIFVNWGTLRTKKQFAHHVTTDGVSNSFN